MAYNNPQLLKILAVIARKPGNNICADCSMSNPTWASFNLGVFICMNCSGVHRMIGTHITRVRSITLDHWDDVGVQTMATTGNRLANLYWEAKLPAGQKINQNTDENTRTRFIRAKYEQRLWYGQPSEEALANQAINQSTAQSSHHPDEAGMTREQKIAFRQQRAQSTNPSTNHQQSSYTPQPTHQSTSHFNTHSADHSTNQPQLRHATSLPQISQHSVPSRSFNQSSNHSTNADDLFAGLTPKVNVQSPPPSQSYNQSINQSSPSPPPVQRPKRITGASPWVQRPAGSEPVYQQVNQSVNQVGSAANYYASMAADQSANQSIIAPVPVAAAPIDLMNFADPSPTNQSTNQPISQAPSGGFDFLGGDDQLTNQSATQSYGAPGGFDMHNVQSSPEPTDQSINQSMSAFSFFDSNQSPQSDHQSTNQSNYQPDYQSQYQQSPPPQQQPQHAAPPQQQYVNQPINQSPPAQSEPSGFDFVHDSSADQSTTQSSDTGYGFDFVNDTSSLSTNQPTNQPTKAPKSRIVADAFSDLVPESDAALPELEPLGDIQRKSSSDGLLAAISAPNQSMPGYPPQQPYGYPPVNPSINQPHYQSPPGAPAAGYPSYGQPQYPPQHAYYPPPTGAPGYAYPPYASPSASH